MSRDRKERPEYSNERRRDAKEALTERLYEAGLSLEKAKEAAKQASDDFERKR